MKVACETPQVRHVKALLCAVMQANLGYRRFCGSPRFYGRGLRFYGQRGYYC